MKPVKAETRATAIRIGNPASGERPPRVIERLGGWCEQASEQEIALAKAEIGAEGVGCEPASAVTLAGLKKLVAQGKVSRDERAVLILTGHTLKDSQYTIDYHRGELLTAAEVAGATPLQRAQHDALRKPPLVLEANHDVVLRALEAHMKPRPGSSMTVPFPAAPIRPSPARDLSQPRPRLRLRSAWPWR